MTNVQQKVGYINKQNKNKFISQKQKQYFQRRSKVNTDSSAVTTTNRKCRKQSVNLPDAPHQWRPYLKLVSRRHPRGYRKNHSVNSRESFGCSNTACLLWECTSWSPKIHTHTHTFNTGVKQSRTTSTTAPGMNNQTSLVGEEQFIYQQGWYKQTNNLQLYTINSNQAPTILCQTPSMTPCLHQVTQRGRHRNAPKKPNE